MSYYFVESLMNESLLVSRLSSAETLFIGGY